LKKLLQYYQIFSDLSLDVVMGVCCNMIAIDYCFHLHMSVVWYVGLTAATWMVYLSDHLFDIIKSTKPSLTSRHQFIRSQQKSIIGLITLLFVACTILLIMDNNYKLIFAAAMCVPLIIVYFGLTFIASSRFHWLFNKELLVAFIYTFSIYSILTINSYDWPAYLPAFLTLFVISYCNLLMMSILEMNNDIQAGKFSWALLLGNKKSECLLFAVFIVGFSVIGYGMLQAQSDRVFWLMCIYLFMLLMHIGLFIAAKKTYKINYVRNLSDIAFWSPIVIIVIH